MDERVQSILKNAVRMLHLLNCSISYSKGVSDDVKSENQESIYRYSLQVVICAGAEARMAVPCHSCRSVAYYVAKSLGPDLHRYREYLGELPPERLYWARQRKAFMKASGFEAKRRLKGKP
jgi:hypothetical protein